MTVAYFDCFSGISGDMVLGAMVDLGVPFVELKAALASLPVGGYEITARHVQRCGIGGTQVQVKLLNGADSHHHHDHKHDHDHSDEHSHSHSHDHEHDHGHSHSHEHHGHSHDHHHENESSHSHSHDHSHDHSHAHSHDHHHHHRGFNEIRDIINKSDFSASVKQRAIEAFRRIAVEEAAVHETTMDEVHFHEVGAVDAIVDIVGAMWCVERLGITRVLASSVAVGSGTVFAAHGEMPVPAPATARLLKGKPICTGPVSGELTTPTGAAILTTLAESFGPLEGFVIDKIGYGAGTREYPQHTNYLRVLLGDAVSATYGIPGSTLPVKRENLLVVMAEIDDMPAELLGAALDTIMQAGALDCHFVPIQMKKNRPATSLHVLTEPGRVDSLLEIIFKQTTTLGAKVIPCERLSLPRRTESVSTPYGEIGVKVALWADEPLRRTPEYNDCLAAAKSAGVGIIEVYRAALAAAESASIVEKEV